MAKHYVGEVGTTLVLNTSVNISAASVVKVAYKKPDGTQGLWNGSVYNTNYVKYTLQSADIDLAGTWEFMAYVETVTWKGYGDSVSVEFYDKFDEIAADADVDLVEGTNTFCTLAEAETYFRTRLGAANYWRYPVDKIAALVTAYKYLVNCGKFTFPTDAVSVAMKEGQCEMALFLIQHLSDIESRQGIQAQGVIQADIVGETYDPDARGEVAIPPLVMSLLEDYNVLGITGGSTGGLFATDVTRDDEEDV